MKVSILSCWSDGTSTAIYVTPSFCRFGIISAIKARTSGCLCLVPRNTMSFCWSLVWMYSAGGNNSSSAADGDDPLTIRRSQKKLNQIRDFIVEVFISIISSVICHHRQMTFFPSRNSALSFSICRSVAISFSRSDGSICRRSNNISGSTPPVSFKICNILDCVSVIFVSEPDVLLIPNQILFLRLSL